MSVNDVVVVSSFWDMYKLPIASRPAHPTPLVNRLLFYPVFVAGALVILSIQAAFIPIGVTSWTWITLRRSFGLKRTTGWMEQGYEWGVRRTKQLFGMLLIVMISMFAPTTITLTSDDSLSLDRILVRPNPKRSTTYLALPSDLVIMSNHQAYLDWIFIWILGHLSVTPESKEEHPKKEWHHGSRSLIILLKKSLKWLPLVGWGMQVYRFIFLARHWAQDQGNLSKALRDLGARAKTKALGGLWVLIFPEGTITSDDERAKSVRYAQKEGVPDFVNVLHPRSTGLLFILRTLTPQIPTLRLLDITIGYPGVTRGGYAQEWYGLTSVFIKGIPPPTIHVHLRMIDLPNEEIPGVTDPLTASRKGEREQVSDTTPLLVDQPTAGPAHPTSIPGLATEQEAKAFNGWLRKRWGDKEVLLDRFTRTGGFSIAPAEEVDEVQRRGLISGGAVEVPIALW